MQFSKAAQAICTAIEMSSEPAAFTGSKISGWIPEQYYRHLWPPAVREFLRDAGVEWSEAPRLVRGLDYYTRTTVEFSHEMLGAPSRARGPEAAYQAAIAMAAAAAHGGAEKRGARPGQGARQG